MFVRANWVKEAAIVWLPMFVAGVTVGEVEAITRELAWELNLLGLLIGTCAAAAAIFGTMHLAYLRAVAIDLQGIDFIYRAKRVRVPWKELVPPPRSALIGYPFEHGPGSLWKEENDVLSVTKEQAKAILQHPSCPRLRLSPALRKSLSRTVP